MIKIILILAGMLLTCGVTGALFAWTFRADREIRKLILHAGYAYTLLAFYVFYSSFRSASLAVGLTLALPLLIAGAVWVGRHRNTQIGSPPQGNLPPARQRSPLVYPFAASVIVMLLAGWPYFLAGWGNYWNSGTRDIEDGLNGRDAYIENRIFDAQSLDIGIRSGDRTRVEMAKATGTLANQSSGNESYREWYAGDNFRFQYSSLAFWSELFAEPHGVDAFLLQALLNLILMSVGIYYLAADVFGLSPLASFVSAVASTGSTFYLTTFFAGHEGSLIYGSLIPALMYAVLVDAGSSRAVLPRLGLGMTALGAILFAYPHPLAVVAPPLTLHWFFSRDFFLARLIRIRLWLSHHSRALVVLLLFATLLLGVATLGLWQLTEKFRLYQAVQYRAWGFLRDWLAMPLFLGFIPPPLEGIAFLGSTLSKPAYMVLIVSSAMLLGLLLLGYGRVAAADKSRFLFLFGACWIVEGLVFRFFIVDSYYFYKFLYTHQFVLVLGFVAYAFRTRSRIIRALCVLVFAANLACDGYIAIQIHHRPFNQDPRRYEGILQLDPQLVGKSFVAVTGGDGVALRQTLKANGRKRVEDPREAEYYIVPSNRESDITAAQLNETIAQAGAFALKRVPKSNYLLLRGWNEPEQYPPDPVLQNTVFRWIGNGRQDYLGIFVIHPFLTSEMRGKFLRICFQKGPSAEGDIGITVTAAGKTVLNRFVLSGGVRCIWLPADQVLAAEQPLIIHSGANWKSLLPNDDRILLYRVFAIGWTDGPYDGQALAFLNNTGPDIIQPVQEDNPNHADRQVRVHLGHGWEARETFGGQSFRWAGYSTELILKGGDRDGVARITMELEPGPSHGRGALQLGVFDEAGKLVFTAPAITGRSSIVLPLLFYKQRNSIYTLRTSGENLPVPGDPRILNYRVFRLELQ